MPKMATSSSIHCQGVSTVSAVAQGSRTQWRQPPCWRHRAGSQCCCSGCGPCKSLVMPVSANAAENPKSFWPHTVSPAVSSSIRQSSGNAMPLCRLLAGDRAREWALEQGLDAAHSADAAGQARTSKPQPCSTAGLPSHTINCSLQDPEPRHRSTYIKPLLISVRRIAIEEHC